MKSFERLHRLLNDNAIAVAPDIYSQDTIAQINRLVDPILAAQQGNRRYVSALELQQLGLLETIFSPTLQKILTDLIPEPELYHCHIYEISANQSLPHIKSNNQLHGWHRDTDCKHDFSKQNLQHISFFVYLTNVENNGGCFEISDKKLTFTPAINNRDTCYQLIGNRGYNFFFDRKALHRASPNRSEIPRRVLKISIQTRHLFNHKKRETIFKLVRENLSEEQLMLKQLFGDNSVSAQAPDLTAESIQHINEHAQLPLHCYQASFTLNENITRWYRDVRFILRRLAVKYLKLNDKKVPAPKIPFKEQKG